MGNKGQLYGHNPWRKQQRTLSADHWLVSETEKGGPNELVIDAKGRYPAVIKPWVIWQSSVWSDYHARQHKGLPPALGLISSFRALYRALVGDWKVQTLSEKSADQQDSSSRPGSLKLTCCYTKSNQAEDLSAFLRMPHLTDCSYYTMRDATRASNVRISKFRKLLLLLLNQLLAIMFCWTVLWFSNNMFVKLLLLVCYSWLLLVCINVVM